MFLIEVKPFKQLIPDFYFNIVLNDLFARPIVVLICTLISTLDTSFDGKLQHTSKLRLQNNTTFRSLSSFTRAISPMRALLSSSSVNGVCRSRLAHNNSSNASSIILHPFVIEQVDSSSVEETALSPEPWQRLVECERSMVSLMQHAGVHSSASPSTDHHHFQWFQ